MAFEGICLEAYLFQPYAEGIVLIDHYDKEKRLSNNVATASTFILRIH
jgi:hypothetical protein